MDNRESFGYLIGFFHGQSWFLCLTNSWPPNDQRYEDVFWLVDASFAHKESIRTDWNLHLVVLQTFKNKTWVIETGLKSNIFCSLLKFKLPTTQHDSNHWHLVRTRESNKRCSLYRRLPKTAQNTLKHNTNGTWILNFWRSGKSRATSCVSASSAKLSAHLLCRFKVEIFSITCVRTLIFVGKRRQVFSAAKMPVKIKSSCWQGGNSTLSAKQIY